MRPLGFSLALLTLCFPSIGCGNYRRKRRAFNPLRLFPDARLPTKFLPASGQMGSKNVNLLEMLYSLNSCF